MDKKWLIMIVNNGTGSVRFTKTLQAYPEALEKYNKTVGQVPQGRTVRLMKVVSEETVFAEPMLMASIG